jgi:hypothetical protein
MKSEINKKYIFITLSGLLLAGIIFSVFQLAIASPGPTTIGENVEIGGQLKITSGSPGAGKVLVSDAQGIASWDYAGGMILQEGSSCPEGYSIVLRYYNAKTCTGSGDCAGSCQTIPGWGTGGRRCIQFSSPNTYHTFCAADAPHCSYSSTFSPYCSSEVCVANVVSKVICKKD